MKSINILSNYFPPHIAPSSNRVHALSNVLNDKYKVRVFYNCIKSEVFTPAECDNVEYHPVFISERNKSNFVFRVFSETYNSIRLNLKALQYKSDLTIVSIPDLMLLPTTALFNCLVKRKAIVDIRDLIWRYAEFKNGIISRFMNNVLTLVSKWSLKSFTGHVCVTNRQKDYLDDFTGCCFKVISNGIEVEKFNKLQIVASRDVDKPSLTYIGTLGYMQNLLSLYPAFKRLSEDGITVNLVGGGVQYNEFEQLIKRDDLSNLHLHGKVNWDELVEFYSCTSILFAQLRDLPSVNTAEPSKLFEYLSTGKPILYMGKGAANDLLSKFEMSYVVEPEDPDVFYNNVIELTERLSDYDGGRNRKLIECEFLRENQLSAFISLSDSVLL